MADGKFLKRRGNGVVDTVGYNIDISLKSEDYLDAAWKARDMAEKLRGDMRPVEQIAYCLGDEEVETDYDFEQDIAETVEDYRKLRMVALRKEEELSKECGSVHHNRKLRRGYSVLSEAEKIVSELKQRKPDQWFEEDPLENINELDREF